MMAMKAFLERMIKSSMYNLVSNHMDIRMSGRLKVDAWTHGVDIHTSSRLNMYETKSSCDKGCGLQDLNVDDAFSVFQGFFDGQLKAYH